MYSYKDIFLSKVVSILQTNGPSTCSVLAEKINERYSVGVTTPQLSNWLSGDRRFVRCEKIRESGKSGVLGGKVYLWGLRNGKKGC